MSRAAKTRRNRGSRGWAIAAVVVLLALLGAFAVLGPSTLARATADAVGEAPVEVVRGVQASPGAGWTVEPFVPPFPASPLTSWATLFDEERAMLRSPDRVLAIDVEVGADPLPELADPHTETLASGAQVRHESGAREIVAVVEGVGDRPVAVRASVPEGSDLDAYRPVLSELIESLAAVAPEG